jgi:hydroxymethylbilane synthase
MKIRVGSRGSTLARYQSGTIVDQLRAAGHEVELEMIRTEGDRDQHTPFAELGVPGIFVRAIEESLLAGRVDLAVHSYKDLPSVSPPDLCVGAVPPRADPTDAVLTVKPEWVDEKSAIGLRTGAKVGTASARRSAWLERLDPRVQVENLRGNLPRRVQQLFDGKYDAIVLASAGIDRLQGAGVDLGGVRIQRLSPQRFIPAPSQGALALQIRRESEELGELLEALCGHEETTRCVAEERALLRLVEGGCSVPFGAICERNQHGEYELHAALFRNGRWFEGRVRASSPSGLAARIWARWQEEE